VTQLLIDLIEEYLEDTCQKLASRYKSIKILKIARRMKCNLDGAYRINA
jgi:hypothetical protein